MVRLRFLLLATALAAVPSLLAAQDVVPGDTLHIRLLDRLGSDRRAPTEVRALVISPIVRDGARVVVPPGSIVTGHVAGAGMERYGGKRHWIALHLDSVAIPIGDATSDTVHADLTMRVASVDDARESVDSAGRIVGPPIPSVVHSKRDWAIFVLSVFHPVGALVLAATLEGERAERHRAVALDVGTELSMAITRGTTLNRWPEWKAPPRILGEVNPDSIAASAPLHTELRAGGPPGDIISIALIGSADQVRAAFAAAGWTPAVPMTFRNAFVTFVKAAKGKGYQAQPMSELVLDGRPPDRVYEKVADTFEKRHHLRMWCWPRDIGGVRDSTLWLVAATHDIGLTFSSERHSFTHLVDPRIDDERDKIVSDLIAAKSVAAMSYVSRSASAPADSATVNSGRSPAVTDWRMAVLVLESP